MASVHDWIDEKTDKALNAKIRVGDKPYYDVVPQRNPNDPVDRFAREQAPKLVGALEPEAFRANLGFQGNPRAVTSAIPAEAAISHTPTALTNPFFAGSRSTTALNPNYPGTAGLGRTSAIPTFPEEPSHVPFAAISPDLLQTKTTPSAAPNFPIPEGYTVGPDGMIRSVAPPAPAAIPGKPATPAAPATRGAISPREWEGATWNEPTRWDMARGLANAGVPVPQMSRDEMIQALTPPKGQGGLANPGSLSDEQLRTEMDRKGLSYFKMSDEDMRRSYLPVEADKAQNRPAALFTGGDFGNNNPEAAYNHALKNSLNQLDEYFKNPNKYGPQFIQAVMNGIRELVQARELGPTSESERRLKDVQSKEYGPNSQAHRELEGSQTALHLAQAGVIPSTIEENAAKAGYYNKHGKEAPLVLNPGQVAVLPSQQHGAPATEIARGLTEKPGNPAAIQHMTEADKQAYTASAHIFANSIDPTEKAKAGKMMDFLNDKYGVVKAKAAMPKEEAQRRLKALGYKDADIEEFLKNEGLQ